MSVRTIYKNIGVLVEKRTISILLIVFALMLVSVHGAVLIEDKSGTDTFVDRNSDIYQNFDHLYKHNFGSETIAVLVESDDVTDVEVLKAIDEFCLQMETDKDVQQVLSLSTIIKSASYSVCGYSGIPEDGNAISKIIAGSPAEYIDRLMPDIQHTIILVEMPGDIGDQGKKRVLSEVRDTIEWTDFPAGTQASATGEPAFLIDMGQEMTSSLMSMLLVSFVLMIFALLVVFRHVRWSLLPLVVVLVGLVWTFGAKGYVHIPMTMASMAVFPILIGLGADYAIQFHNRAEEELAKGESPSEAIINTVKNTGPAVGIAVMATSLGFVALFISTVPMIRDFGKMSLIGVILCYVAAIFVLVPLLYLLDKRAEKKGNKVSKQEGSSSSGKFISNISVTAAQKPIIIISLAVLLAVAGLYADERVGVQTDVKEFVPQDMQSLQDLDKLNRITGGSDQINIIVKADDIRDPDVIMWMNDFGDREVETLTEVVGSDSIATTISMGYGSIPSEKSTIDAILDMTSPTITDRYINGGNMGVLNLNLESDLTTEHLATLIATVEKDLSWYPPPPGVSVTATGVKVTMTSVIGALTSGRTAMGYLGLAVIFGGMLLVYRDLMKAVVTVLPILMVTGWIGGVMYLLNMEYNPLTATLGALVIGIGAEFTILMMERYFEERDNGLEPFDAMERAASKIGQAIIASGSTVIFGFSALIVSPFPMIQAFGIVTVIAVAFSLFSTLVVLPPIMVNLDIWRSKRRNNLKSTKKVNV